MFRDGAVLQRDKPITVWGVGASGERVEVRFRMQVAIAVTDADGRWQTTLKAEPASAEPAELVLVASNTVIVREVLVGDVWLCSGQSNMEWTVAASAEAEKEIADARDPLIRHFKVPHTPASVPQQDCKGEWQPASPETAGMFTAVGYYFAREWRKRTGIPVGLINSTWGGTQIESWMCEETLRQDPAHAAVAARWQEWLDGHMSRLGQHQVAMEMWHTEKQLAATENRPFSQRPPSAPEAVGSRREPSSLYHGMIHPLLPYTMRGILWYQGEANGDRAAEYRTLFQSLIRAWRMAFGQSDLPFGFVQLANFERPMDKTKQQWAYLREAQAQALALPATGMAVTIDIGNLGNIHPENKQEVGRRLALWAQAEILGDQLVYSGPRLAGMEPAGTGLRLRFTDAAGMHSAGRPLGGFELAGADGVYVSATARIDRETLVLTALGLPEPKLARYAWSNSPDACLFNAAGLPAAPFRTH